jgi:putative glutathione S-transferase
MNDWLFDNVNNGVYKTAFGRSKEAYWDAFNSFYAALDILEERLENQRFLFGDYVTDSDIRLYVTLARLDIRYTFQLGHVKKPLFAYKNLWAYARDLYQIPAFKENTYFKDFAKPGSNKTGRLMETFNARFLDEIDFDKYWGAPHNRARLSSDPGNKFKAEQ